MSFLNFSVVFDRVLSWCGFRRNFFSEKQLGPSIVSLKTNKSSSSSIRTNPPPPPLRSAGGYTIRSTVRLVSEALLEKTQKTKITCVTHSHTPPTPIPTPEAVAAAAATRGGGWAVRKVVIVNAPPLPLPLSPTSLFARARCAAAPRGSA